MGINKYFVLLPTDEFKRSHKNLPPHSFIYILYVTQLSQASVESGFEVVRSLRFKVLRTIQTVNLKIVDELLGTRNCEADERERINEKV